MFDIEIMIVLLYSIVIVLGGSVSLIHVIFFNQLKIHLKKKKENSMEILVLHMSINKHNINLIQCKIPKKKKKLA